MPKLLNKGKGQIVFGVLRKMLPVSMYVAAGVNFLYHTGAGEVKAGRQKKCGPEYGYLP